MSGDQAQVGFAEPPLDALPPTGVADSGYQTGAGAGAGYGVPELDDLLAQIDAVDTDRIAGVAQQWRGLAGDLEQHAGNVGAVVKSSGSSWSGPARDGFAGFMQPYDEAGQSVESMLRNAASELDNAVAGIGSAKSAVDAEVRSLVDATAGFPGGVADPQAADQVSASCDRIRGVIDDQITRPLSTAADAVTSHAQAAPAFTALDSPSGEQPAVEYAGDEPEAIDRYVDDVQTAMDTPSSASVPAEDGRGTDVVSGEQDAPPLMIDHNANPVHNDPSPDSAPAEPSGSDTAPAGHAGHSAPTDASGQAAAQPASHHHSSSPSSSNGPHAVAATHHPAGSSAGGGHAEVSGNVQDWISQAMDELKKNGVDTSNIDPNDVALIIQNESGGDPNAVNNWDSNAANGTPSEGLMQTIQPTFDAYKLPGHDDIFNPVDNIIAGIQYAIHRYGSIANVPGVVGVHDGGSYVGY